MLSSLYSKLRHWLNTVEPRSGWWLSLHVLAAVAAGVFLQRTGGPWQAAVQHRLAAGKDLQMKHWIPLGIGWGCMAFLAVAALLFLTARWWMRPTPGALEIPARTPLPKKERTLLLLALLGTLVGGLMMRQDRLGQSFWNDEEMAFRSYVWGTYKTDAAGQLRHEPLSWDKALYLSEKGNNHVLSTVESRLGLALLNDPAKGALPGVPSFQESAARRGAWLSGGLVVMALGWLGHLLSSLRLGLTAGILMALHPWAFRFSGEMRGYSSCLLWVVVAAGCLIQALQTSLWRWWLGFGLSQALFLLAFSGAAFLAISVNGAALGLILWRGRAKLSNALRLISANGVSLMVLGPLLFPALLQTLHYVKSRAGVDDFHPVDTVWLKELWTHLCLGLPQAQRAMDGSRGISLEWMAEKSPLAQISVWGLFPLAALWGLSRLWKGGWPGQWLILAFFGGLGLVLLNAKISGMSLLIPYVAFFLPIVVISWGACGSTLQKGLFSPQILLCGLFFFLTQEPLARLRRYPRQPMRETAQIARNEATVPAGTLPGPLTATFGQSAGQHGTYDPRVVELEKSHAEGELGHLKALEAQAQDEKRSLVVYFCNEPRAQQGYQPLLDYMRRSQNWRRLADAREFLTESQRQAPFLLGLETRWTYQIWTLIDYPEMPAPTK